MNIKAVMAEVMEAVKHRSHNAKVIAQDFGRGAKEGLGQFASDVVDTNPYRAAKAAIKQPFAPDGLGTPFNVGHSVGRATVPVGIPAGVGLTALVGGLKEKSAEEREELIPFIEGFVKACADQGADPDEMWKLAWVALGDKSQVVKSPEQGFGGLFKNFGRQIGGAYAGFMGGEDRFNRYNKGLMAENSNYETANRGVLSGLDAQMEENKHMWTNPESKQWEVNPTFRAEQYGKARIPGMQAMMQNQRAMMQAQYGGAGGGSMPGTGGFYSGAVV